MCVCVCVVTYTILVRFRYSSRHSGREKWEFADRKSL